MTPDPARSVTRLGPADRPAPAQRAGGPTSGDLADLDALRSASQRYQRMNRSERPARRRSWPISLLCALLVGVAIVWVEGFEYACTVELTASDDAPPAAGGTLRGALRDYLDGQLGAGLPAGVAAGMPQVETLADGGLRLTLRVDDRARGQALVERLATGFLGHVDEARAAARNTPGEAEAVVAAYIQRLQNRLTEFNAQAARAAREKPSEDPAPARADGLELWESRRAEYEDIHATLTAATEELRRLEAAPPPRHGMVTAEDRRLAIDADEGLVQDLRELDVQLGELKSSTLLVAQEVAERLAALDSACDALGSALPNEDESSDESVPALPWGDLPETVERYRGTVAEFRESFEPWSVRLRGCQADPHAARILDMHQEASTMFAEFVHRSSRLLASMRDRLQTAGSQISDTARHHVLHSDLIRRLAELRRAHDRFGFAADQINPTINFKIDAPLRSARGLRKRSRAQIRRIEGALETEARERARAAHDEQIEKTKALIEETRSRLDENVATILRLQADLNLSAKTSEAFLKAVLEHQFASDLARAAREDMLEMKTRLDELRARRTEKWADVNLVAGAATVDETPVNLYARLRTGVIAALATLLTVGLVQWWAGRR